MTFCWLTAFKSIVCLLCSNSSLRRRRYLTLRMWSGYELLIRSSEAWWCSIISLYSVVEINRTDLTSRRSWRRSRRRCPAGNPGSATVHPGSAPCHRHHTGERKRSTKTHKWNISLVAPLNTLLLFRKMHDAFFIMHYYWLLTCYITTPKLRTASLNWCIFI